MNQNDSQKQHRQNELKTGEPELGRARIGSKKIFHSPQLDQMRLEQDAPRQQSSVRNVADPRERVHIILLPKKIGGSQGDQRALRPAYPVIGLEPALLRLQVQSGGLPEFRPRLPAGGHTGFRTRIIPIRIGQYGHQRRQQPHLRRA